MVPLSATEKVLLMTDVQNPNNPRFNGRVISVPDSTLNVMGNERPEEVGQADASRSLFDRVHDRYQDLAEGFQSSESLFDRAHDRLMAHLGELTGDQSTDEVPNAAKNWDSMTDEEKAKQQEDQSNGALTSDQSTPNKTDPLQEYMERLGIPPDVNIDAGDSSPEDGDTSKAIDPDETDPASVGEDEGDTDDGGGNTDPDNNPGGTDPDPGPSPDPTPDPTL